MLPLSSGARWGWTAPSTLGLLVLAIVFLVLWVRHKACSDSPLVDMPLMRRRAIWTTNLASLLIGASMFGVFAFLPRFVQTPASSGYGFDLGSAYAAMTTLVVAAVPASQTEIATGMNTNLRTIGGALGSTVMSSLVFGSLDPAGLPLEPGYTAVFVVLAVLALGAGVVALGVRVPAYETQPDRGTELDERKGVTQPAGASALVA